MESYGQDSAVAEWQQAERILQESVDLRNGY
jgi:hypothetical protein